MRRLGIAAAAIVCLMAAIAPSSQAARGETTILSDGSQRTTYTVGPINVTSGQNRIDWKTIAGTERPSVDGWITHITPNLVNADGTVPPSSKIMFHHGVWINNSNGDRFFATGEEKTDLILPPGYGYRYRTSDQWMLNHMIHNLVPQPTTLYITYTIDFIPDSSPLAEGIKPVYPIWMDVENGKGYPVFDTYRDSGGADGEYVYPQDRPDAYAPGRHPNELKLPSDGVLVATTGHVHTGGLSTDLYLRREGASYAGGVCEAPENFDAELAWYEQRLAENAAKQQAIRKSMPSAALRKLRKSLKKPNMKRLRKAMKPARFQRMKQAKRKRLRKLSRIVERKKEQLSVVIGNRAGVEVDHRKVIAKDEAAKAKHQACLDTKPNVVGNRVHLFESKAEYFEPAGPVSWDMAMYSTHDDWQVAVKKGDVLEIQTTYETERASWYENMGINIVYASLEDGGNNPYETKVDKEGVLNHGHYPENEDHGGGLPLVGPDPATLPDGLASGGPFLIGNYSYQAGDFRLPGAAGRPPVVKKGQSFTFQLSSADSSQQIWHSLTSCKSPCNKSTGIAYPIADGSFQFDSGQLGTGGDPTVGRNTWTTPPDLPVGTHTYFCRIHPLMRGAFRVVN